MTGQKSKYTLLVVDDSEMNRAILAEILADYNIVEAKDGREAIETLKKRRDTISLVLLDYVMPVMNGFEVLKKMKRAGMTEDIPVIMISSENSPSYVQQAFELGVIDFISRPFDALLVQHRVANTLQLYTKQKKLARMVEDQIVQRERQSSAMVHILSNIVEFRNGESGMHVLNIQSLVKILLTRFLKKIRTHAFRSEDIDCICMASCLHDIGKIAIPSSILNKPGKLTPEEYEIMKTHSAIGADMLSRLPLMQDNHLLKVAADICRWHHERFDGKGYPDGLKGDEIPISAQVVSLADVYDALTSKRVYKDAIPHDKAVRMILDGECGAFNPKLLDCLKEVADDLPSLLEITAKSLVAERTPQADARTLLRKNGIQRQEHALSLLERERTRSDYLDAMTEEVEFEYTIDPPTVRMSSWAAEYTGWGESFTIEQDSKKMICGMTPDEFFKLSNKIKNTTPENPAIDHECRINVNGRSIWARIVARSLWSDDDPPRYKGVIGKMMNIDAMKSLIETLEYRATHDSLTGVLTRAAAEEKIKTRLNEAETNKAFIMLDVDFFKQINDSYGHAFGDTILKRIADKLNASVHGERDIVARVGGDEFFIYLENYKDNLGAIAGRIFNAVTDESEEFRLSVSMGIAEYDALLFKDPEQLFLAADRALYTAKQTGRGKYLFYDSSMEHTFSNISRIADKNLGENE